MPQPFPADLQVGSGIAPELLVKGRQAVVGEPSVHEAGGAGHTYFVFGLSVRSSLPLPELFPASQAEQADAEIVLGKIERLPGERDNGFAVTEAGGLLHVPGVGRYLIQDGRRITVEPAPSGSERHLRLYLLGSAIGVLLHQRNLLPLHANAVDIGGRAVAFMGASGAGKSTMAAWFHDRGYSVLADDVCVVTFGQGQQPLAHPGIPRLRLWRDALESSGRTAADYEHAFDDADKYNVPTREKRRSGPIPLSAVYLLDEPNSGALEQGIVRLTGIAALDALVANTYRGGYAPMLGALPQLISACQAVMAKVPVFAVRRIWGREHLDRQLGGLERHALAAAGSGAADFHQTG